jgi:NAD(P)-dependent dehydrogenase (short-subunit alcohol dehydrogenase family)
VAVAALFLASEESSWTTGVILDVAGGSVMVHVRGMMDYTDHLTIQGNV